MKRITQVEVPVPLTGELRRSVATHQAALDVVLMQVEFESAARWLAAAPEAATLPNDVKLEIYGIYKTVTEGPVPNGPRPSVFYLKARAKYDAWESQGRLYADRLEAARARYLSIAAGLGWQAGQDAEEDDIDWDAEDETPSGGGGLGLQVSSIQAEDQQAGPVLHEAVVCGDLPRVRGLLDSEPETIHGKGQFGYTALHLAADRGQVELVKLLLDNGADIDAKDEDGETPLDVARIADKTDVINLLMTYKSDA